MACETGRGGSEPCSSKDFMQPWAWQARYMKPWKAFFPSQKSSLPSPLKNHPNCQTAMRVIMAQAFGDCGGAAVFQLTGI